VNGKLSVAWLQKQATIYAARIRMANDLKYAEQAVARGETEGALASALERPDGNNGGSIVLVARPGFYRTLKWFLKILLPRVTFDPPPKAPAFLGYHGGYHRYMAEKTHDR
jgi:hypothetical protein